MVDAPHYNPNHSFSFTVPHLINEHFSLYRHDETTASGNFSAKVAVSEFELTLKDSGSISERTDKKKMFLVTNKPDIKSVEKLKEEASRAATCRYMYNDKDPSFSMSSVSPNERKIGVTHSHSIQVRAQDTKTRTLIPDLGDVDLFGYYKQNPRSSLEEDIVIYKKVLLDVQRLHRINRIHGDIKLQNIAYNEASASPQLIDHSGLKPSQRVILSTCWPKFSSYVEKELSTEVKFRHFDAHQCAVLLYQFYSKHSERAASSKYKQFCQWAQRKQN